MSYTLGPWEWFYDGGGTYSIGQVPDAQANPPHVTIWDRDNERAIANCHLIAAAPDLLTALRNMVREWESIIGDESVNGTPADTLEKAKAAITKAEGRTA